MVLSNLKSRKASRQAAWLVCASLCFACAQPPSPVPSPAAGAPQSTSEYVLQRGDDLEIRAYNQPELDAAVRIRPDGKISVLLLNDIQASGLTPEQLSQALIEGFSKHFRSPRITVIVKSFAAQTVYVGGEVGLPAAIPLRGDLTAVQAVLQAGGIKDPQASDEVTIVHHLDKGNSTTEKVSVKDVILGQKPDKALGPSDVVYVQRNSINVYVGGEVTHPGMIPLTGDLNVLSAVIQAGGFRLTAKTNEVVLLRDSGKGTPVASKIRLNDVFLSTPQTKLQPFDVVYVPKSRIAKLNQWMEQYVRQMSPATLSVGFSYLFGQSFGTSGSTPF
jgi:polysaccharide biosynthesis/export protein